MVTVEQLLAFLEQKAPFALAEDWDNSGLLVGDLSQTVSKVLVVLDITDTAVDRAVECGAQLIVSHHPVIFEPLRTLSASHPAYRMAAHGIAALCMHTNLDKAVGGVNDLLAQQVGLTDVFVADDGFTRVGKLPFSMTAAQFGEEVSRALKTEIRISMGTAPITTVAVCGGSGADLVLPLLTTVDAAVTGEVKHHEWLTVPHEKTLIDGGHFMTEIAIVSQLTTWLQEAFPAITVVNGEQTPPYQTIKG